jgi:hypothetical protein
MIDGLCSHLLRPQRPSRGPLRVKLVSGRSQLSMRSRIIQKMIREIRRSNSYCGWFLDDWTLVVMFQRTVALKSPT